MPLWHRSHRNSLPCCSANPRRIDRRRGRGRGKAPAGTVQSAPGPAPRRASAPVNVRRDAARRRLLPRTPKSRHATGARPNGRRRRGRVVRATPNWTPRSTHRNGRVVRALRVRNRPWCRRPNRAAVSARSRVNPANRASSLRATGWVLMSARSAGAVSMTTGLSRIRSTRRWSRRSSRGPTVTRAARRITPSHACAIAAARTRIIVRSTARVRARRRGAVTRGTDSRPRFNRAAGGSRAAGRTPASRWRS